MSNKRDRYLKYLKERYVRYLKSEQKRCFPAKRLGLKECQRCGYCCIGLTCVPRPDEIEPIAGFLGLTIHELVDKYMVIDKFVNTNYFLRWVKEGQEDITGTFLSSERALDLGYCILFEKGGKGCRIHPIKPQEAKDWKCWEDSPEDPNNRTGASYWKKYDITRFVPGFWPEGPPKIIISDKVYV